MMKVRGSFSFGFRLLDDFFFGVFRSDDLKLPLRGSFTIQAGGTMIRECRPEMEFSFTCIPF